MSDGFSYPGHDLDVTAFAPRYQDWILDCFRPFLRGAAAEYGAGIGTMTQQILPHVASLDVIEPARPLAARLQDKFADDSKVRIFGQSLEERLGGDGVGSPGPHDAVILINVLEHIEDDVAALHQLRKTLSTGGHLLLFVPALPFLFSKFDRLHGHYRRYTKGVLSRHLQEAGFQIRLIRYMDMLGTLAWFMVNTLGRQTRLNPAAVKTYDRLGVPLTKFGESIIRPPFGKNIIAVAQNPGPEKESS